MREYFSHTWHIVRWPLFVIGVAFVALVAWRYTLLVEQDKTDAAVAAIHANRLTEDDVFGPLPKEPNKTENDATLAGVDVNANGIRDDVERAIYFKYQNSAKEAAPAYQYAKALQMEFTDVYNAPTLVAVIQEESRGFGCIFDRFGNQSLKERNRNSAEVETYVDGLVFNTSQRKEWRENIREKYMVSYGLPNGVDCDLSL